MDDPNKNRLYDLEKNLTPEESKARFEAEKEISKLGQEKKEISDAELELIREELKREIDLMETDETKKKEAEDKAKNLGALAVDEIIANLLEVAKEKDIVFALKIAKKINDPFVLDTFHDVLAREGYYKNFANKRNLL